jgi:putative endonuclease
MYRFYVYILTNKSGTLYVGISKDVEVRQWQHGNKTNKDSFTAKYNINKLIYYEEYQFVEEAILREKQLKNWNRKKKLNLIKNMNPTFEDLLKTTSEV